MDLQERLSTVRPTAQQGSGPDPFSEIKNRIHLAVIGELGPQLFNVHMDPIALRERVFTDIRGHRLSDPAGQLTSQQGPPARHAAGPPDRPRR